MAQALYAYVELLDPVEAWRQVMRDLEGIRPVLGKARERAMKALKLVEPVRPAPKPEPEMLPSEAARCRLEAAYLDLEAAKKNMLDTLMDDGKTLEEAYATVQEFSRRPER